MTHYKQLMDTNYLGSYSLEPGQDIVLTIKAVRKEPVVGADGKKEDCIVCYWAENEKPMILNATNCKTITKILKTPYIEEWAGHKIQIGSEKVRAFGDVVDALRVRSSLPKAVKIVCEECGKDVLASNGMTADQVAAYTAKKYGRKLCAECAKKEAAKNESQQ